MPSKSHLGRQEYQAIFLSSPDAIMLTTPGGEILAANPAACRILGRSEDELRRLGRSGVVDESDPRLATAIAARERDGHFLGELTFVRASGETFPAEIITSMFPDGLGRPRTTLIFRDISERKRTEAALRLSEEKFAKAFHTSPDGITITRLFDGRYLEVNQGFVSLSGYHPDEVVGQTSVDLHVWVDPRQREQFVQTLNRDGEVLNLEADFRFKNGVIKSALVSARLMEIGGEACVLSTTRDMTDKKKAEDLLFQEKRQLAESLLRTQKLESLGQLAAGIAHDFNNMLGGIFGFLELVKESLAQGRTERLPYFLEKALGIHGRARSLTQQLLTFSQGGAPFRTTLLLEPLLRTNVAFALSGSTVTCDFTLDDELWTCEGDEHQLGQVVDNLVLNAKQAMGPGGRLRITARNRRDPSGHPGAFVQISVADEGPGILPENLPRIFDPFFSTKESGHGLGLATVFSIVHRHEGWVDVESVPGQGATFHVFLPASTRAASLVHDTEIAQGEGRVLVMDDEESLQEVAAELLRSLGYRPTICSTGPEAVRLYQEALDSGHPFAAAILDLTVPGGFGGSEAARQIRLADSGALLIAASGYSDAAVFHRPEDFGFAGRIAKPYLKRDLAEILSRLLPV